MNDAGEWENVRCNLPFFPGQDERKRFPIVKRGGEEAQWPDSETQVEKDSALCPGSLADGGGISLAERFRGDSKVWSLVLGISENGVTEEVWNAADVGIFMETDNERLVLGMKTRCPNGTPISGLCLCQQSLTGWSSMGSIPVVIAACKASAMFGRAQKGSSMGCFANNIGFAEICPFCGRTSHKSG